MTDRELAMSAYDMCLRGAGDPPFDGIEVNYAENLVYAAQKVRETGVVVSTFDQHVANVLCNPPYEIAAPVETVAEEVVEEVAEDAIAEAPKPKKRTKAKPVPIYKSAKTGKIVTEAYALRNPDTTFAT